MFQERPYIVSIAGFDPSAGAGLMADVKTFEQHRVYGFGVSTVWTVQNDSDFLAMEWMEPAFIIKQLKPLVSKFDIKACKIGLIQNPEVLFEVISFLKSNNPEIKIVLDPVWKASAGYELNNWSTDQSILKQSLKKIDLVTPNLAEMQFLGGSQDVISSARTWAEYCPVLLKGGHNDKNHAQDLLFERNDFYEITPANISLYSKHGSGCVLSSAIASNLALGLSLLEACKKAKLYIEEYLNSNPTLLGYHKA